MQRCPALARELTKQAESDDTLPGTRTAGDDDDLLGVGFSRALDCPHHHGVRHLLFVQKDELLPLLDLRSRQRQKLLTRPNSRAQQVVSGRGPRLGREPRLHELDELTPTLAREHPCLGRGGIGEQPTDIVVPGVVEVSDAREPTYRSGEIGVEVSQVLAVATNLRRRMEPRSPTVIEDHVVGAIYRDGATPLLQFDHDIGSVAGLGIHAAQKSIHSPAGQGRRYSSSTSTSSRPASRRSLVSVVRLRSHDRCSDGEGRCPYAKENCSVMRLTRDPAASCWRIPAAESR